MSLFDWCRDTVTVQRAPLVEERGSVIPDWDHAAEHEETGCSVQPAGASLSITGGLRVENREIRWDLWVPLDADIRSSDRVIVDGAPYRIINGVLPERGPTGMIDHRYMQLADWKG
ncbi:hypothetical protein [Bifidobacterium tissieri]|uniref:hypothetical protein n=1 Tax=Bifidobacterium tissieri TaxID=1630162 RepID=UPI00123B7A31|nr:hypothetical protein [Bifidobacterium tissieri]KAA8832611.1 hypothetical protein EM849_03655 [Bifidobacterium tissieri]